MNNRTITRGQLNAILDYAGLDTDNIDIRPEYSGRYMYGRTCVGVTFDTQAESYVFMAAAALVFAADGDDNDEYSGHERALELAHAASTDSMGRGMILYFPGWTLEDEA